MAKPGQERPPDFLIRLRPLTGIAWRTSGVQRLKLALKRLLRDYGLRCLECRPDNSKEDSSHEHNPSRSTTKR